jgi:hypothetical protein
MAQGNYRAFYEPYVRDYTKSINPNTLHELIDILTRR